MNRIVATAAVALTLLVGQPVLANAAEVHVWTARAIATVLAEIGPRFERTTGHRLNVYSGLPGADRRRDALIGREPPRRESTARSDI